MTACAPSLGGFGQAATQVIYVTAPAGAVELTWGTVFASLNSVDISAGTIQISLGTDTEPGDWKDTSNDAAQVVVSAPDVFTWVISLRVDDTTPVGVYRVWVRLINTPDTIPRPAGEVELR